MPKEISLMSMHTASYLLKLLSGNENVGMSRADNCKNLTEFAQ